jgi:hypothetical protein
VTNVPLISVLASFVIKKDMHLTNVQELMIGASNLTNVLDNVNQIPLLPDDV